MPDTLSPDLLHKMHAYWRAANYLSVGQIYLQDNPLRDRIWDNGAALTCAATTRASVARAWYASPASGGSITELSVTGNCRGSIGDALFCRLRQLTTGQYCSIFKRNLRRGICQIATALTIDRLKFHTPSRGADLN